MDRISRLIRADGARRTRFHTGNGHFCLQPVGFLRALSTTVIRLGWKKYSPYPWLVYPATAYIATLVSGRRVFEFGSGMSTVWFARRSREVISVENHAEWYNAVMKLTRDQENVRVIFAESRADYVGAIAQAGGKFDLILIDGKYRKDCVEGVRPYLTGTGVIVVDNTDVDRDLAASIKRVFGDSEIRFFRGWAPGILHPNETTVIQKIPVYDRNPAAGQSRAGHAEQITPQPL